MTRFKEIKNMIAAARCYDDTNAIEELDEMSVLYMGSALTAEEREELDNLLDARNARIAHAIQIAAIAVGAAEKARGGLVTDYDDIHRAAYDICLDEVENF